MANFKSDTFNVSFSVADEITVRQQLRYKAVAWSALNSSEETFVNLWRAAVPLITNWKCTAVPDPAALDMDKETSPEIGRIAMWTGNTVAAHMSDLGNVKKNS